MSDYVVPLLPAYRDVLTLPPQSFCVYFYKCFLTLGLTIQRYTREEEEAHDC